MEIIHVVIGKANPERMNGVNKVVHQLATHQVMAGKKVVVWGITADTTHNYPERNFETRLFKAYTNKFRLDKKLIGALQEKKGSALFHLHGGFNPFFYSGKQLAKHSIPYVFTPHGAYNTIAMQKSWWRKKIYLHFFEKPLLKRASAVHSLGASEVNGLRTFYQHKKSVLIPYGFEISNSGLSQPAADSLVIGFCGRIDIYTKGLDILLEAFSMLQKDKPAAQLWIIGNGNETVQLMNYIDSYKLGGNITLWGSKFGDEKNNLLKKMNLFVHPSRNEGLPTAILEAAALGIPSVVTEATNLGEVIRKFDAGETIAELNSTALVGAIERLIHKINVQGQKTLGLRNQQMVEQEFNWNHIVKRFDTLYTLS